MANHSTSVTQLDQTVAAAAGLAKLNQQVLASALKAKAAALLPDALADDVQTVVVTHNQDSTTTENSYTPSVDTLSFSASSSTDENAVSGATAEELNASSGQAAPEVAGGLGAGTGVGSIPFATMMVVGALGLSQTAFDDSTTEITGTANNDILNGDSGNNKLIGLEGNDELNGAGGNDELNGGLGNNILNGGEGTDTVVYQNQYPDTRAENVSVKPTDISMYVDLNYGYAHSDSNGNYIDDELNSIENVITGNGEDYVNGNEQANYISVGDGSNYAYGEDGNDTLIGGNDYNSFYGGNNNDSLVGGSSYDELYGQDGNDTLIGGDEAEDQGQEMNGDWIEGGAGNDYIDGGAGFDYIGMGNNGEDGSNVTVNLNTGIASSATEGTDTLVSIEGVNTGYGDDFITGNAVANSIDADSGSNTVYGMGGDDYIYAYSNNGESQYLDGGAGNDVLYSGAYGNDGIDDTIIGGTGDDTWTVEGYYLNIDSTELANVSGIEKISLDSWGNDAIITLTVNDVLNMSDTSDALIIEGYSGGTVFLNLSEWESSLLTQTGFDGNEYNAYTAAGGATLLIDVDLTVSSISIPL